MLTNREINDCDAVVNLLRTVGPLTAREIYAVNGRTTGRVLGHLVQTGRVSKSKDLFQAVIIIETMQPDMDWGNQ